MALDSISASRNTYKLDGTARTTSNLVASLVPPDSAFASLLKRAADATSTTNSISATTSTAPKSNAQQLEDYVNMTPEQRMRADLLKKLGMTEEELANMSPEERAGFEEKMKAMVQELAQQAAAQQEAGTRRIDTVA